MAKTRRLFCLKSVYPPSKEISVNRYNSIGDYDREWDKKFSTVTAGTSIAVKSQGYRRSLGSLLARNVPLASAWAADSVNLTSVQAKFNLTSIKVIPAGLGGWNEHLLVEVCGRRARDVDMAAVEILAKAELHSQLQLFPHNLGSQPTSNGAQICFTCTDTRSCFFNIAELEDFQEDGHESEALPSQPQGGAALPSSPWRQESRCLFLEVPIGTIRLNDLGVLI